MMVAEHTPDHTPRISQNRVKDTKSGDPLAKLEAGDRATEQEHLVIPKGAEPDATAVQDEALSASDKPDALQASRLIQSAFAVLPEDIEPSQEPGAVMASSKSSDPAIEHEPSSPQSPKDIIGKGAAEAGAEDGVWNKVKAVGRELDRNVGGEYERREDTAADPRPGSDES